MNSQKEEERKGTRQLKHEQKKKKNLKVRNVFEKKGYTKKSTQN
jgi:hypothetical protein